MNRRIVAAVSLIVVVMAAVASVYIPRARPLPPPTSAIVDADGGQVSISQFAVVTFPADAFPGPHRVEVSVTSSPETARDFEVSAVMFDIGVRSPYEVRINSGSAKPQTDFGIQLHVPQDFLHRVPAGSAIQVFAQIFGDDEEPLDHFELFESTHSGDVVTVTLPPDAFTDRRRSDGTYEAIVLLAATPTNSAGRGLRSQDLGIGSARLPDRAQFAPGNATCPAGSLGAPLDVLHVTGRFDGEKHWGVDYRAPNGTPVRAMANGTVERIDINEVPLKEPDPRSQKMVKGWGRFVVLKHEDGSRSLYGHLERDGVLVSVDETVVRGEIIALSDNTGGSSAPHLHVEYALNGKIYAKPSKVNVDSCIEPGGTARITVRDDGAVSDDAFRVAIGGVPVCETEVGTAKTCTVSRVRRDLLTLRLTATKAPDDVATYELMLAGDVTLDDGSTSVSGELQAGRSTSFFVIVR